MRKQIIKKGSKGVSSTDQKWINLEYLARVEVTSEDPTHPIESALILNTGSGWRAESPGMQTVRILFDKPQRVSHIHLAFHEDEKKRTHEFVLRWSSDGGKSYREIVRQQYNFSPPSITREIEDYTVDLDGMTVLELEIVPDINRGNACASVEQLLLA